MFYTKDFLILHQLFRKSIFFVLFFVFFTTNCTFSSNGNYQKKVTSNRISKDSNEIFNFQVGAERMDLLLPLLKHKKVALLVNQTSVVGPKHIHLLDTLLSQKVDITTLFSPEHGFRGNADAGEVVQNQIDSKTGISIISLYGKNKKPTAEQLKNIDVLVFDIQDVGARFYTYISTLLYALESCVENQKEIIVLDRPNPNDYVDGPMLKENFKSFVGVLPLPLLHGLTMGELAKMIQGEKWLKGISKDKKCKLTVIPMKNWEHKQPYLLPVKPSPNLPNARAIQLYPSLCLFEATQISVGRGTLYPFQQIGYPNSHFGPHCFTPHSLPGFDKNPLQKDKICYGIDLRTDTTTHGFSLKYILQFYHQWSNEKPFITNPNFFDKLAGSDLLRKQIQANYSEDQIRSSWQSDLEQYKVIRKKYLLYKEK